MSSIDPVESKAIGTELAKKGISMMDAPVSGGLAGSTVLDAKAPMMMEHNFRPGFRIELHIKDLANALNAAHATDTSLPLTASVMEMMQAIKNDGCGKEDHSALVKYYEKISDVSVEKEK